MVNSPISNEVYDLSLREMRFELEKAKITDKDQEAVRLAEMLIQHAVLYDQKLVASLLTTKFSDKIDRNFFNPTSYTSPSILDQSWSDRSDYPLNKWEEWNKDRRANNNGMTYEIGPDGLPINPYCNYGIQGRGIIGRYGPNHAVDNGVLKVDINAKGKPALYALGIIRNDSGLPALCGGFTNFVQYGSGSYPYTIQVKIESQAQEFFEEMVSGSVELMDAYAEGLEQEIECNIKIRENYEQTILSDKQRDVIRAQVTTHRKLNQVKKEDPLFMCRLRSAFREAKTCYEGPVLSSSRNTNTAWMETKLSYFMMDNEKWNTIKGDDKFHYQLSAGDDAGKVMWHEITPELIRNAESHSAFFTYLMSGYLLTHPSENPSVLQAIKAQGQELLNFFMEKPISTKALAYQL